MLQCQNGHCDSYDGHMLWFQEFVKRCETRYLEYMYSITPQEDYSNLEWNVLVTNLKLAIDCIGHQLSDCLAFKQWHVTTCNEQEFDYDTESYWCPILHREHLIL